MRCFCFRSCSALQHINIGWDRRLSDQGDSLGAVQWCGLGGLCCPARHDSCSLLACHWSEVAGVLPSNSEVLKLRSLCDSNPLLCQDWTKPAWPKVVGGLICLGVSVTFMSIFGTVGCLDSLAPMKDSPSDFHLLSNRCHKVSDAMLFAFMTDEEWRPRLFSYTFWWVHFAVFIFRIPVSWSRPCKRKCTWVLRCCIARKEHGLPPNPNIPETFGSSWIKSLLQIFQCRFWHAIHTLPDFLRNLQVLIDADAAS